MLWEYLTFVLLFCLTTFFFEEFTDALFFEDFTAVLLFEDFTDAFFCWVAAKEGSGKVMVEKIKRLRKTKINFLMFHLLYLQGRWLNYSISSSKRLIGFLPAKPSFSSCQYIMVSSSSFQQSQMYLFL